MSEIQALPSGLLQNEARKTMEIYSESQKVGTWS